MLQEAGPNATKLCSAKPYGTDLSNWMVRQGWVKPNDPPEPALADAAEAAKSERIGLWRRAEYGSISMVQ
jgi:endonuclease YncB( thermonuclease family)